MLNILKVLKRLVTSSPQYGYQYLIKRMTGAIYLFNFIVPISVTCYSIIMNVVLVIEAVK